MMVVRWLVLLGRRQRLQAGRWRVVMLFIVLDGGGGRRQQRMETVSGNSGVGNFDRRGSFQAEILFYFVYQLLDRNNIVIVSLFTWHIPTSCPALNFYAGWAEPLFYFSYFTSHTMHNASDGRITSKNTLFLFFDSFPFLFLFSLFISCYDFSSFLH